MAHIFMYQDIITVMEIL